MMELFSNASITRIVAEMSANHNGSIELLGSDAEKTVFELRFR